MKPTKAPGIDGFPTLFYHKYWDLVSVQQLLNFFNKGGSLIDINKTLIVLIPKVKDSKIMSHFRLISLCNVFNKIIVKVYANRMKPFLFEDQSAFVPNRLITDNVLVAYEVMHNLKNKK